jgi:hypothetical protein
VIAYKLKIKRSKQQLMNVQIYEIIVRNHFDAEQNSDQGNGKEVNP